MDELDRMLRALPREPIPEELAATIRLAVRRRHRRRLRVRRAIASLLAVLGAWLLWPGIAWMWSSELFASGTPWLAGTMDALNSESLDLLSRLWNSGLALGGAIGSAPAASVLLGAVLVCFSIFLALDRASWLPISPRSSLHAGQVASASGIHL